MFYIFIEKTWRDLIARCLEICRHRGRRPSNPKLNSSRMDRPNLPLTRAWFHGAKSARSADILFEALDSLKYTSEFLVDSIQVTTGAKTPIVTAMPNSLEVLDHGDVRDPCVTSVVVLYRKGRGVSVAKGALVEITRSRYQYVFHPVEILNSKRTSIVCLGQNLRAVVHLNLGGPVGKALHGGIGSGEVVRAHVLWEASWLLCCTTAYICAHTSGRNQGY
jgi:hypothetical protein